MDFSSDVFRLFFKNENKRVLLAFTHSSEGCFISPPSFICLFVLHFESDSLDECKSEMFRDFNQSQHKRIDLCVPLQR